MKKILLAGVVLMALGAASCNSTSSSPSAPSVPACQTNNTATVTFSNRSVSGRAYDVSLDGISVVKSLLVGQDSAPQTVAAGSTHTIQFKFSDTGASACNPATPSYAQCSSNGISCSS